MLSILNNEVENLRSLRLRDIVQKLTVIALIGNVVVCLLSFATILTQCNASLVVVLSGSMEPGYKRGDILFVHHNSHYPVQVGDIIIFSVDATRVPIVHRVHRIYKRDVDSRQLILTKGDNNEQNDVGLYRQGRDWIEESEIIGKTFFYIPKLGYLSLFLGEFVYAKFISIGVILILMLASNDT